jgi:ABC-2 type transport system ATP-binding protein
MKEIINCTQVDFRYNRDYALNGFTLQVEQGEVVALLGPNGAGKTTSVRVMNGLLPIEAGTASVFGLASYANGTQIRARTGVLTETPALYERLTALQNLRFFGTMAGMAAGEIEARSKQMLEMFGLVDRASDRVDTYSKGMKQRLAIARAMLHDPEVLFLDEPTSDLDPETARQVGDVIREISARGKRTVVLCTHRLLEAEQVSDRVAVMKKGRVIACGGLEELRQAVMPAISVHVRIATSFAADMIDWLRRQEGINAVRKGQENVIVMEMDNEDAIPMAVAHMVGEGAMVLAVEPRKASLEDIYLYLQQNGGKETA